MALDQLFIPIAREISNPNQLRCLVVGMCYLIEILPDNNKINEIINLLIDVLMKTNYDDIELYNDIAIVYLINFFQEEVEYNANYSKLIYASETPDKLFPKLPDTFTILSKEIAQLVQQGKVNVDDKVRDYILKHPVN